MVGKQGDGEMFGNLFKKATQEDDQRFVFLRWETFVRGYCPICKKEVSRNKNYNEEFGFLPDKDIIECPDCHIALYGEVTNPVKVSAYVEDPNLPINKRVITYRREPLYKNRGSNG